MVVCDLACGRVVDVSEMTRLARTVRLREDEIFAYHTTCRSPTAPLTPTTSSSRNSVLLLHTGVRWHSLPTVTIRARSCDSLMVVVELTWHAFRVWWEVVQWLQSRCSVGDL